MRVKVIALVLLLVATACGSGGRQASWSGESGKLRVLSTTAIVGDMVSQIGGDQIDALVLIGGALDPHSYELVKGDDEKLAYAELIFASGLGLEHGPSLRRYLSESDKTVSLGDAIVAGDSDLPIYVEGELDPHIWMDVSLWSDAVKVVAAALGEQLPDHAQLFHERADHLIEELSALHEEVADHMAQIEPDRRYLFTTHDCLNYFSRAYLATDAEREAGDWMARCDAPEGLSPEGQLSARDIQSVVNHLVNCGVAVLFPESNQDRDALRKIAEVGGKLGLQVRIVEEPLYGDALGEEGSGASSYVGMMRHNAQLIRRSLCES